MIGKTVLDVRFARLAEPDKVRRDAIRHRSNQWKDIPPYVRRGWVPVQKKRNRCFGISHFPVRHGRTQNIHLGKYNVIRDFHYLLLEFGLENTVSKTMSLKRSRAAGLGSTLIRRNGPSPGARRK